MAQPIGTPAAEPETEDALCAAGAKRRAEACKHLRSAALPCALTNRLIQKPEELVMACFFAQQPPQPRWFLVHLDSVPGAECRAWANLSSRKPSTVVCAGQVPSHWKER